MTDDKRPGTYNKEKGSWGEERAAAYLKEQGYAIRERNYRGKTGEIAVDLPDGNYVNRIDNSAVPVKGGKLVSSGKPIVLILPR